jgi:hypothetical protein
MTSHPMLTQVSAQRWHHSTTAQIWQRFHQGLRALPAHDWLG